MTLRQIPDGRPAEAGEWTAVTTVGYPMGMASGRAGTGRARTIACLAALGAVAVGACGSPAERAGDDGSRAMPTAAERSATPDAPATTRPRVTTTTTTAPPVAAGLPAGDDATVSRIVDGDTLWVDGPAGPAIKVRLIGIDTPEPAQDECYSHEATDHLAGLVPPGTPVRVAYDAERFDRYDRTLAYVYRMSDGLFANLAMARDGFAHQLTIAPNVAHADEFGAAVAAARAAGRGLWGAGCGAASATTAPPPSPPAPAPAPVPAAPAPGPCDASYPGVCIPPAPPDLDCPQITARGFTVLAPDPHGFDGDHDGVGCET